MLDRIVGYDVSALVWCKLAFGLSAGRVQSVALRLIVDREREIEAFVPEEYWNCGAALAPPERRPHQPFVGRLVSRGGEKLEVKNGDEAARVRADLEHATLPVAKVTKSERKRNAPAPYTTSKLQQDAVNRLGFGAKRTMQIAQGLYEGVDLGKDDGGPVGLITYMRTDSTRLSPDAVERGPRVHRDEVRQGVRSRRSRTSSSRRRTRRTPTRPSARRRSSCTPESVRKHLKDEQFKLYKLIWDRFVASQMTPAVYDQTSVDIEAKPRTARRRHVRAARERARPQVQRLARGVRQGRAREVGAARRRGRRRRSEATPTATSGRGDATARSARTSLAEDAEASLPELAEGQALHLVTPPGVLTEQKFTQPPPRYNEGSLVRELEERGIGRPSTYAEIISKVQARDYVEKIDGGALPPDDARQVRRRRPRQERARLHGPRASPSKMEEELDEVEAGNEERVDLLKRFYKRFRAQLDKSKKGKRWNPEPEPTEREVRARRRGDAQALVEERLVPRLRELPGVQEHARPRRRTATPTAAARDRHRLRQVRQADGHPERALRRVPLVHGLPRVQEREAGAARRHVPEVRRRHHRDPLEEARRQDVLRLLELRERGGQVRLQALAEADRRAVPAAARRSSSWAARGRSR